MKPSSSGARVVDQAARAHQGIARRTGLLVHCGRICLVLAALLAWQLASGPLLDPFFFSRPSDIGAAYLELVRTGHFFSNVLLTLEESAIGYVCGAALAVVAALALGVSPLLYAIVEPFLLVLYATPAVALAPLIIIWFGLGILPKVIIAGYFVFFIVFLNGVTGVRGIPDGWLRIGLTMGARRHQLFSKIILRGALPHIVTGMKAAVPQAVIGAMVGEFISARRGLGYMIAEAAGRFNTAAAFAGIITLALLVVLMMVTLHSSAVASGRISRA